MSISGSNFELPYKKGSQEILSLEYKDKSDGSATLTHPICINCEIIFDQSSVKCLKEIDSNPRKYTFKTDWKSWAIYLKKNIPTILRWDVFLRSIELL